jgi:hypothetical protein
MKYDYYGNYDNSNDIYSFNINDIHKKQKEREINRVKIYERIASRCFKKIKEVSANEDVYCFFRLPEYIPGYPIYNMTECVMFLLNLLKEKGFSARYCDGFMLYITWNLPKPNLRLINSPNIDINNIEEEKPKKSIIDGLNLKYKPIESSTAFGNFLPKKKFY